MIHTLRPFKRKNSSFAVTSTLEISKKALHLQFTVAGPVDTLHLPRIIERPNCFQHELWQHTCFELFIREALNRSNASLDQQTYFEFNFAADGRWACYLFSGYRKRSADLIWQAPLVQANAEAAKLIVLIEIPRLYLFRSALEVGLHCILEERAANGTRESSFWSLCHPRPEQADFHHPESFCLPVNLGC